MLNNLLAAPVQIERANNSAALAALRRQAISVAVLARVHIAYEQYIAATKDYKRASEEAGVDRRLLAQISNGAKTDTQSELERVSAQVNAVYSELRSYQAYSEMQAALGRIYAAMGIDPVSPSEKADSIAALSAHIRKYASDWRGAAFPIVAATSPLPPQQPTAAAQKAARAENVPMIKTAALSKPVALH